MARLFQKKINLPIQASLTLLALGLMAWFAPVKPFDPWDLFSPKKIIMMIFALALIQALGSLMSQVLGTKTGAILTGFLGGLISSTATTASLARSSLSQNKKDSSASMLVFLSATIAMLFEGLALVLTGTGGIHLSVFIVFLGPILATLLMIVIQSKKIDLQDIPSDQNSFDIFSLLKLSCFIILVLSLSKILQKMFGQSALLILTFLVSLFEIHGSVIANTQLHDSGVIGVSSLTALLAVSIMASYLSKIFLISSLGTKELRNRAIKSTIFLFFVLFISWFVSESFINV